MDFCIDGDKLKKYRGKDKEVFVPEEVRILGEGCFAYRKDIESIYLNPKVRIISKNAFFCCENLKTINTLDEISVIEDSAFYGCKSLENIDLKGKILFIGNNAFAGCASFVKIMIMKKLGNEKIALGLEKYIKKFEEHKEISDVIVDECFNDICVSRKVCDLMLKINNNHHNKYEVETENFKLQQAKNILMLWENVLEQENGLYNYVNEVMDGEAILLFLYRKEDLGKVIATIEICDERICRFIYKEEEEVGIEVKEWFESYVREKKLSISGTEFIIKSLLN